MKIRIAGIPSGLSEIRGQISPADLKLDPAIYQLPLNVAVSTEKNGEKIALSVRADAEGHYICDRCGEEFTGKIGGDCKVIFIQRDVPLPDEMPGDDLRTYRLGQQELDISTEVLDALMLSVPLKLLCREDCKGICTICGVNLNLERCPHCN